MSDNIFFCRSKSVNELFDMYIWISKHNLHRLIILLNVWIKFHYSAIKSVETLINDTTKRDSIAHGFLDQSKNLWELWLSIYLTKWSQYKILFQHRILEDWKGKIWALAVLALLNQNVSYREDIELYLLWMKYYMLWMKSMNELEFDWILLFVV